MVGSTTPRGANGAYALRHMPGVLDAASLSVCMVPRAHGCDGRGVIECVHDAAHTHAAGGAGSWG